MDVFLTSPSQLGGVYWSCDPNGTKKVTLAGANDLSARSHGGLVPHRCFKLFVGNDRTASLSQSGDPPIQLKQDGNLVK